VAPILDGMPEFENFGAALRYYREHIAERLRPLAPGRLPDIQLTAKEVVSCMREAGYSISQPAFSDIEAGSYLPKDPAEFMEAVVPCLALEQNSPAYFNLMDHLVRDVLRPRLKPEALDEYWLAIRAMRRDSSTEQG
jgi:hypothetical protein